MRPALLAAVTLALVGYPARSEEPAFRLSGGSTLSFKDLAEVSVVVEPPQAKPGEKVTVKLTVAPKPGTWTYPVNPPADQFSKNDIGLPSRGDLIFVGGVTDPPGAKTKDSAIKGKKDRYYPSRVTWELAAVVSPRATPGPKAVPLTGTQLQVCNERSCYPSDRLDPPVARFEVAAGPAVPVPAEHAGAVEAALTAPSPPPSRGAGSPRDAAPRPAGEGSHTGLVRKSSVPPDEYRAGLDALRSRIEEAPTAGRQGGLLTLLATAAAWGIISLATPCVFPMVPITVSLFLKQSHQSTAGAVRLAAVYCLTIVAVLGGSAVFLLSVFRALSTNPYMSLFLAGLFVVFALSLFGLYDLTLPGSALRFTEKRRGAGGLVGTVFAALAFSIVSFTCVAPFLGGFAGMAATGNYSQVELVSAGLAFAAAFASPFFVLALFPSFLKKLPRSGGWLDTVKAVMGFVELAAALKFLRQAEIALVGRTEYFTYDLVLGAWVATAAVTGAYLLNLFRLPHDEEKANVGVVRMLFGLAFVGFAAYLLPGLFKGADDRSQRPRGEVFAWVDAFLLPEPSERVGGEGLPWSADLPGAVERVIREKRNGGPVEKPLILVDFTGEQCTNCTLNEVNVFPRPEVRDLLGKYRLVQVYTDKVPEEFYANPPPAADRKLEAAHNLAFQRGVFGTEQLPLYAILEPLTTGKVRVVAVYDEGKINDVGAFVEFLKKPLQK